MNPRITTIIFDCFGVICNPPIGTWYKTHMLGQGRSDEMFESTVRKFDLGDITEEGLCEYFAAYAGIADSPQEIRKQIDGYLSVDADLLHLIARLRQRGFTVALLSNGNHALFERKIYAEYPEFKQSFDHIFLSSQMKLVKPDPNAYLYALNALQVKPEEVLFIDDRAVNVDAAQNVGIHGHVYTSMQNLMERLKELGI